MKFIRLFAGFYLIGFYSKAATITISTGDFAFSPKNITANIGDTVEWIWTGGIHSATSTSVPAGASSWDSPIDSANMSYKYGIAVAGTYLFESTPDNINFPGLMTGTITVAPLGISVLKSPDSIGIYPSPATENIHVNWISENKSATLEITNLYGESRIRQHSEDNKSSLSVESLFPGIYFLKITDGKKIYLEKFIKQ